MPKGEFLFALYLITTFGWASGYQCGNQPVRQAGLDVLFTIWPPRRSATVLGVLARGAYSPERLICAQAATLLASSCPTATAAFQPSRGRCSGRFSGRAKRSGSMICRRRSSCSTQCGNQPVRQAGLEVFFTILAASTQCESAWCPRTRRLRLTHGHVTHPRVLKRSRTHPNV